MASLVLMTDQRCRDHVCTVSGSRAPRSRSGRGKGRGLRGCWRRLATPSESSGPGADPAPRSPIPPTPVQTSAQSQAAPPFRPRKGTADTFPQELIKGPLSVAFSGRPFNILSIHPHRRGREDQATEGAGRPGGSPAPVFSTDTRKAVGAEGGEGSWGEARLGAGNPGTNPAALASSHGHRVLVQSEGIHITCE